MKIHFYISQLVYIKQSDFSILREVMNIDKTEFYNEKLRKKMQAELDKFIADWKTKSSADTVELAYELTYKEEIMNSFDFDWVGRTPVSVEQAKALLALKHPLDYLYQEWIEYDDSPLDMLRDSNNLAIEKAVNHIKSRTDIEMER